jgi:glycosyltransferase involved in cell wall biosynthesis
MARVEPLDVVHVLSPAILGAIGRAAAEICHAPLVASVDHYTLRTATTRRRTRRALIETLTYSDAVIADSTESSQHLDDEFGVAASVIPPGTHFVPQACSAPRNSVPRILYTGKLLPHKGLEYLLRAVPFLLAERRVKLIIAGDGEHARTLRTLSQLLHIQDKVEFLGYVSTERLHEEYSRCDIWVNPSVADDPGGSRDISSGALEAYTYRRPVVATNVGYSADVVQHGRTGWLVAERDEFALSRAILDLIQQPSRARMFGESGFRHILENFSWESICDRQEAVYLQAVARRRAGHASRRTERPFLRIVRSEAA